MTLTDHLLALIKKYPGRTAWSIAKELSNEPKFIAGSVSSTLRRLAKDQRVRRRKSKHGSWIYYPAEI